MGGMLTQPITNKYSDQGSGLGLRYGLSSMQGWRPEMEDAHDVKIGLKHGLNDWSFFAVFDGHAGKCAAAYAALNLLDYILDDTHNELKNPDTTDQPTNVDNNENKTDNDTFFQPTVGNESSKANIPTEPIADSENSSPPTSSSDRLKCAESTDDNTNKEISKKSQVSNEAESECSETVEKKSDIIEQDSSTNSTTIKTITTTTTTTTTTEETHKTTSTKTKTNEPTDKKTLESESSIRDNIDDDGEETSKFISSIAGRQTEIVSNSIRTGFLRIDQSMRSKAQDMSGCTAVCALISPKHLYIANCGDSRAVLYDGMYTKFVTEDHKPFNPRERKRIIEAGGTATQRINGTLAVSRALGDFDFKKDLCRGQCEQLVSPEPEVTVITRLPNYQFLILACDGIWDVMSNNDLCKYVKYLLTIEDNLEEICSKVLDVCLRKGSRDNMSIIIVVFEGGPKVSQEKIAEEKENDELLMNLVDTFMESNYDMSEFNALIEELREHLYRVHPNLLTPGAGIEAKYDLLRDKYEKNLEKLNREKKE